MSRTLKKYNAASLIKNRPRYKRHYQWKGLTRLGEEKQGVIAASNKALVRTELRQQGILTKKIIRKRSLLNRSIKPIDQRLLTRHLATLTQSGIGLMQAIEFFKKDHANPSMRALLSSIQSHLESGLLFADALRCHPTVFDAMFCQMIHAGEQSGTLDVMLEKLATHQEKRAHRLKAVKKACTYPFAVILMAILVTAGLLIFVIPPFERLFTDFNAELPALTRFVLDLSRWIQTYGLLLMLICVAAPLIDWHICRYSSALTQWQHKLFLKTPLIGGIMQKTAIARFSHMLSITFGAGLPLNEALTTVAGCTGNGVYANGIHAIQHEISNGQRLSQSMRNTALFPDFVIQLIAIGEESGTLERMLNQVAVIYDEEIDQAIDASSSILEPVIMAILGLLVGGLVIAMYLPILKLGTVV